MRANEVCQFLTTMVTFFNYEPILALLLVAMITFPIIFNLD